MLSFIIGGCGCGKTTECIERMTALENTNDNIICIVPQQFTLETERLLLEKSKNNAIMQARVLSFRRLAYVIMNNSDTHRPALSALGRAFIIRKIAYDNKEELSYFSKVIDKQGFLDSLANLISEFYQYGITPEMLLGAYEKIDKNDSLSLKLKDLYTVYSAYRERIAGYVAAEETLDILAGDIKNSDYIKNAHIFIDMMDYFIPQEYKVIQQLMLTAKSVTVALNGDFSDLRHLNTNVYDPYFESKRTVMRLLDMAGQCGCKVENSVFLHDSKRHASQPDLLHLQKNYFARSPEKFSGKPQNIQIFKAVDMNEEINEVCMRITDLVRNQNIRYDNIAVIIDKSYETAVKNKFTAYGIPVFIDSQRPIAQHPLTALVLSVLDILCYGVNTQNILSYAKNIFSPLEADDVFYLENYVLKHNINGKAWYMDEWCFGLEDKDDEDIMCVNAAKDDCVKSLAALTSAVKRGCKYEVGYIIDKIYDLLFELGVDKKLAELTERSKDDQNEFRQHSRIWDELKNVFETLAAIAEEKTDINEFSAILRSGLELCSISIIPPTQDNVIIGDIDRSRLPDIKVLFMLGVNEGIIPPPAADIGLLADRERTLLTERFFELAADNLHKISMTDLNIYNLLLKPQQQLVLSFSAFGGPGRKAVQSPVITVLLKLFPDIEVQLPSTDAPFALQPAFEAMVRNIRSAYDGMQPHRELYERYSWFSGSPEYKRQLELVKTAGLDELSLTTNTNLTLNQASLKKLYNDVLNGSASSLETFAKCPFAYFLSYGLYIKDRDEYALDPLRLGDFFHRILEDFSNELKKEERDWRELSETEVYTRVENCVDGIVPNAFNTIIGSDPHFMYTVKRVKNIISHSINALCTHVRSGAFQPHGFEVKFGRGDLSLPPIVFETQNGKSIILSGKIDRVDIFESDGCKYVKIIDYKSGTRDFDRVKLYYGIQLQLLLYMDSYIKQGGSGRDLLPGGVFYFKVSDPVVENNSGKADVEKLILEEYDMNGLVLDKQTVLDAIGENSKGSGLKLSTLKKVQAVSNDEFERLCNDTEKIVKMLGEDMLSGNIAVRPVKTKTETGCKYCPYGSICRFEARENTGYRTEKILDDKKDNEGGR